MQCVVCEQWIVDSDPGWEPVAIAQDDHRTHAAICSCCIARSDKAENTETDLDVWQDLAIHTTIESFGG